MVLPGVYMVYGPKGDLLYVGQSGNIRGRLRTHAREKSWWRKPSKIRAHLLADVSERLLLETLLILRYAPAHNKTIKLGLNKEGGLVELQFLRTRRKAR